MRTVKDIATIWKKKSAQAIYPGFKSKLAKFTGKRKISNFTDSTSYYTGNLLRSFVQANANNDFVKVQLKKGVSYELVFKISPDGAKYGKYVHFGTSKMGQRPFVEIGGQQKEVQTAIKEFLRSVPKEELQKQKDKLKENFQRLSQV